MLSCLILALTTTSCGVDMKQRFVTATALLMRAMAAKAEIPNKQKLNTHEQFALVRKNIDKLDREIAAARTAEQREAKLKKRYIAVVRLQEIADMISDGRIYTSTRSVDAKPRVMRDKGHRIAVTSEVAPPVKVVVLPSRLLSPVKVGRSLKGPQQHSKRWGQK